MNLLYTCSAISPIQSNPHFQRIGEITMKIFNDQERNNGQVSSAWR